MASTTAQPTDLEPHVFAFYQQVLRDLTEARLPFLVAGAFALRIYTGIVRHTKDLDLFVRPQDYPRILGQLAAQGYRTELTDRHWLAKAFSGEDFVDVIFGSGRGLGPVDDAWFEHARPGEVLGLPVQLCAPEDMIWSKAFVQERERFDGADVAHLIRCCGPDMDWRQLMDRFGPYWRVLFSHLVLFGFVYPGERSQIPEWVLTEMLHRFQQEMSQPPPAAAVCQGTLLSHAQYLIDLEQWGYQDARVMNRI